MPITKADVLAALADPRLGTMRFQVGQITVSVEGYRKVAEYIEAEAIKVKPNKGAGAYYGNFNTIEMPSGKGMSLDTQRVTILHECTHALIDIEELQILRLEGEVAAYLAEFAYMLILNGTAPFVSTPSAYAQAMKKIAAGKFPGSIVAVAYIHNLHNSKGYGTIIPRQIIWKLSRDIGADPVYARVGDREQIANVGVPINENLINKNQMRYLKDALERAKRKRPPQTDPFDLPPRRGERFLLTRP